MRKGIFIGIALIITFVVMVLTPINTEKSNCIEVSGTIKSLHEEGVKDLVFKLENHQNTFYINRALENGFHLNKAKAEFTGQPIKLFYAKSWTPLAPFGTSSKHIVQAVIKDSVIYSEW
jgi:hypothetical protein